MALNRKVTGALAWGGLILIFAVPSAEIISAQIAPATSKLPIGAPAVIPAGVVATDPVQTAAIEPAATKDPVDQYLLTGKPLPAYLSDGEPKAAVQTVRTVPVTGPGTPAPATTQLVTPTAVETAAVQPVAPTPMPAAMRPKPAPMTVAPITTVAQPAAPTAPAQQQPLILDEQEVLAREAALEPLPQQNLGFEPQPRVVTSEELEEWDSGSLFDYLERRGLISEEQGTQSQASFNQQGSFEEFRGDEYDPDGFYLSDGPNNNRRRAPRPDDSFVIFVD